MNDEHKKHPTKNPMHHVENFFGGGIAAEVNSDSSLDSWLSNERWRYVWLQTVARAWNDNEFREKLLENAREAIRLAFGFNLPAYLDLMVLEPPHPPAHEGGSAGAHAPMGWHQKGNSGSWSLPPTKVVMWLPPAPPDAEQAVALADYAHSGRTYPFSTC
ncbi:BMA_0021/BMA_0022 family TOMM bacteriocin [Sorangium atrum]|uniref:BMA_0021/BMA_0022 family TOMM bacteriocin n=1 Tax=Sorangium atrum TaxID=2995308 RepID=A0ABT5C4U2_9BACT|nr:BMA_0021/BMA_0022 family TOMM bacteriocin [Sorangium aterium]MDC0681387.1 BMA_0021/BMA_0022 family TOMM bacteriocin [Sorangium aterium]